MNELFKQQARFSTQFFSSYSQMRSLSVMTKQQCEVLAISQTCKNVVLVLPTLPITVLSLCIIYPSILYLSYHILYIEVSISLSFILSFYLCHTVCNKEESIPQGHTVYIPGILYPSSLYNIEVSTN